MSDTLFIERVESNVKGAFTVQLAPKTIIAGPCGTGKTAILNAVELALTASASSIAGRAFVAADTVLESLAPAAKVALFSKAYLSDGTVASWMLGGKGGKKAQHSVPMSVARDQVLPLRAVRDALLGSAETARKFFLGFAVQGVTENDILARIPEELHSYYRTAVLGAPAGATASDRLLVALEAAKKGARNAGARANASSDVSTAQASGLAPLPTESALKALTDERTAAVASLAAMQKAAGAGEATKKLVMELFEVSSAAGDVKTKLEAANTEFLTAEAESKAAAAAGDLVGDARGVRMVEALEVLWALELEQKSPTCFCCGAPIALENVEHGREQVRAAFHEMEARRAAQTRRRADAEASATAARAKLAQCANEASILLARKRTLEQTIAAAGAAQPPTAEELAAATARVQAADSAIAAAAALKASWDAVKRAQAGSSAADDEKAKWKKLEEVCSGAVASLLDSGVAAFNARVRAALPDGDQFELQLRDGNRQVCRMGFRRPDRFHMALSGAESARMLAALATVCSSSSGLVVLIPDEVMMDADTVARTCRALTSVPAQVLLTTTAELTTEIPGWQLVRTPLGAIQ